VGFERGLDDPVETSDLLLDHLFHRLAVALAIDGHQIFVKAEPQVGYGVVHDDHHGPLHVVCGSNPCSFAVFVHHHHLGQASGRHIRLVMHRLVAQVALYTQHDKRSFEPRQVADRLDVVDEQLGVRNRCPVGKRLGAHNLLVSPNMEEMVLEGKGKEKEGEKGASFDPTRLRLDVVQKIGLATGTELSQLCQTALGTVAYQTNDMTIEYIQNEVLSITDDRVDAIKRAFLYTILAFSTVFRAACVDGLVCGFAYESIDPESMDHFVKNGLRPLKDDFVRTTIPPEVFVNRVRMLVEQGGVHGFRSRPKPDLTT